MSSELVMYFLVRQNLKMSKGKTAAQVGHAVQDLITQCPKPILQAYKKSDHPKICLRATYDEMEDIRLWCKENKVLHHLVIDAGRTEVPPNTETVLGIGPVQKDKVNKVLKHLKLL